MRPYVAAPVHYAAGAPVGTSGKTCLAAIITETHGDVENVGLSVFWPAGQPMSGVYASFDPRAAGDRTPGTWHWPCDQERP